MRTRAVLLLALAVAGAAVLLSATGSDARCRSLKCYGSQPFTTYLEVVPRSLRPYVWSYIAFCTGGSTPLFYPKNQDLCAGFEMRLKKSPSNQDTNHLKHANAFSEMTDVLGSNFETRQEKSAAEQKGEGAADPMKNTAPGTEINPEPVDRNNDPDPAPDTNFLPMATDGSYRKYLKERAINPPTAVPDTTTEPLTNEIEAVDEDGTLGFLEVAAGFPALREGKVVEEAETWPHGVLYYELQKKLSSAAAVHWLQGIGLWMSDTCLRPRRVPATKETPFPDVERLRVINGEGCATLLGKPVHSPVREPEADTEQGEEKAKNDNGGEEGDQKANGVGVGGAKSAVGAGSNALNSHGAAKGAMAGVVKGQLRPNTGKADTAEADAKKGREEKEEERRSPVVSFVKLARECAAGNAAHELGHAYGALHEHARHDRDSYLHVNLDIVEDASSHRQFRKADKDMQDTGKFDFGSIMMYPSDAGVPLGPDLDVNGAASHSTFEMMPGTTPPPEESRRSLAPKPEVDYAQFADMADLAPYDAEHAASLMGQRRAPSPTDMKNMNEIYSCHPRESGCADPKRVVVKGVRENFCVLPGNMYDMCLSDEECGKDSSGQPLVCHWMTCRRQSDVDEFVRSDPAQEQQADAGGEGGSEAKEGRKRKDGAKRK